MSREECLTLTQESSHNQCDDCGTSDISVCERSTQLNERRLARLERDLDNPKFDNLGNNYPALRLRTESFPSRGAGAVMLIENERVVEIKILTF